MSSLSAVRLALEEITPVADQELLADGNMELEVAQAADQLEAHFEGVTTFNDSNEKLYQYGLATEQLLEQGAATAGTMTLLALGIESHMAGRRDMPLRIATENFTSIERSHEVALEDMRDVFMHDFQSAVVSFKHRKDFFSDLFRATNSKIAKYESILGEAQSEYNSKRSDWKESQHQGFMVELWYHFSTDKGEAAQRMMEIMHKDLEMSKYVLETYPQQLLDLMKKLTATVKSGKLTDINKAKDLAKAVERLEHPAELFKKALLGGKPYFGVTGLELKKSGNRSTVLLGETAFPELAKLASTLRVIEDWDGWHTTKKVATNTLPYGHMVAMVTSKQFTMTTAEIGKVIEYGQQYVAQVAAFGSYEQKVINASGDFLKAMQHLIDTLDNKMPDREMSQVKQMVKQVEEFGSNILNCLQSPAAKEVARSLKTARYCGYLSKRMIYNAR